MVRWLAALAVLLAPAPAVAAPLEDHAPFVIGASGEPDPLTSVKAFAGRVPGIAPGRPRPVVYGRRFGEWLQYWMLFENNTQDRGILRTGVHEGDWEMIQLRMRRGRPVQAVYSQHSGAESCGFRWASRGGQRPIVYLAKGSHAAYFRAGVRDRTWPDPNDVADGDGVRVRPRLVRITAERPPWMRYPGRWGDTRAGWVPGEMDSPRGPAFQPRGRWSNPEGWAAAARRCTREDCDRRGECDETETTIAAGLAVLGFLGALFFGVRRMRRVLAAPAS